MMQMLNLSFDCSIYLIKKSRHFELFVDTDTVKAIDMIKSLKVFLTIQNIGAFEYHSRVQFMVTNDCY